MVENDNFYVYMYTNPLTMTPFYVGKGRNDRAYSHLNSTRERDKNPHKRNILNKLLSLEVDPIIEFIGEGLTEREAFDLEKYTIARFGREHGNPSGPLVNCTDGGEGSTGFRMTQESRDKMSIARTGLVPSQESRIKISKANKGKKKSDETKLKISMAKRGKKMPESFKEIMSERGKMLFATTNRQEQMMEARLRLKGTEAYRLGFEKVANFHRGRKRSPETCARISAALKGKKTSDEARAKMSETRKAWAQTDKGKAHIKKMSKAAHGVQDVGSGPL